MRQAFASGSLEQVEVRRPCVLNIYALLWLRIMTDYRERNTGKDFMKESLKILTSDIVPMLINDHPVHDSDGRF